MRTQKTLAEPPSTSITPKTLNMARLAYPVTALGPGRRLVLWVAGCSLRCKGCITPELLEPTQGQSITTAALADYILGLPAALDGITLSGGEPFEQAAALSELLERLLAARPEWNTMAFSGYPLATLEKSVDAQHLLAKLDILIDGPFVLNQSGAHPLTASTNQQIHYLTPRGEALRWMCDRLPKNQANLGLGDESGDMLIGILQPAARQHLHDKLGVITA